MTEREAYTQEQLDARCDASFAAGRAAELHHCVGALSGLRELRACFAGHAVLGFDLCLSKCLETLRERRPS